MGWCGRCWDSTKTATGQNLPVPAIELIPETAYGMMTPECEEVHYAPADRCNDITTESGYLRLYRQLKPAGWLIS